MKQTPARHGAARRVAVFAALRRVKAALREGPPYIPGGRQATLVVSPHEASEAVGHLGLRMLLSTQTPSPADLHKINQGRFQDGNRPLSWSGWPDLNRRPLRPEGSMTCPCPRMP